MYLVMEGRLTRQSPQWIRRPTRQRVIDQRKSLALVRFLRRLTRRGRKAFALLSIIKYTKGFLLILSF